MENKVLKKYMKHRRNMYRCWQLFFRSVMNRDYKKVESGLYHYLEQRPR
jgi:hypothetical protein